MNLEDFAYVVETDKSFEEASIAVLKAIEDKKWAVFTVIDISERLKSKGFDQKPLKIIEMCNGKHANYFLNKNRYISLFMPCRIAVLEDEGKVKIGSMRPAVISEFFEGIDPQEVLVVEQDVREIIDNAK